MLSFHPKAIRLKLSTIAVKLTWSPLELYLEGSLRYSFGNSQEAVFRTPVKNNLHFLLLLLLRQMLSMPRGFVLFHARAH